MRQAVGGEGSAGRAPVEALGDARRDRPDRLDPADEDDIAALVLHTG